MSKLESIGMLAGGIASIGSAALIHLITLPVEFNASKRAGVIVLVMLIGVAAGAHARGLTRTFDAKEMVGSRVQFDRGHGQRQFQRDAGVAQFIGRHFCGL